MIAAGCLAAAADCVTQIGVETKDKYDWIRTIRMTGFNILLWTPISHYKYRLLDKIWPIVSLKFISIKVFLDQFCLAPILIRMFFYLNELLQGNGIEGGEKRIEKEWWTTCKNCWTLWIPVQFANFYIIPLVYRVIYVRVVGFVWAIIVSVAAHR